MQTRRTAGRRNVSWSSATFLKAASMAPSPSLVSAALSVPRGLRRRPAQGMRGEKDLREGQAAPGGWLHSTSTSPRAVYPRSTRSCSRRRGCPPNAKAADVLCDGLVSSTREHATFIKGRLLYAERVASLALCKYNRSLKVSGSLR